MASNKPIRPSFLPLQSPLTSIFSSKVHNFKQPNFLSSNESGFFSTGSYESNNYSPVNQANRNDVHDSFNSIKCNSKNELEPIIESTPLVHQFNSPITEFKPTFKPFSELTSSLN